MEKEGFEIRAIVCDMGNHTLVSQLKIRDHLYYFDNPSDPTRKVYVFPDAPHLLKCLRGALLDHGFSVPSADGSPEMFPLKVEHFEELLQKNDSELNPLFKLRGEHLYCKGSQRQNVSTAAQLLSHTVSKAFAFRKSNDPGALARSKAVKTINDWFDVVNSGLQYDFPKIKSGFGKHLDEQMAALDEMEKLMWSFGVYDDKLKEKKPPEEPRPTDRAKNAYVWWHGILTHIRATKAIFQDLVVNGPLDYILMKRLNQDCLENYFSRFIGVGGDNNHPACVGSMIRVRNLMLTKDADIVVQNPSVKLESKDPVEENLIVQEENVLVSSRRHTKDYHVAYIEEAPAVIEEHEVSYQIEVDIDKATRYDSCAKGLSYVMGYIARKFKDEFPNLGSKTCDIPLFDYNHTQSPWIIFLSKGGLTAPSDEFLEDGKIFEHMFNEFHGLRGEVNRNAKVLDNFTDLLCSRFGNKYHRKVLAHFSKTRTMIRLKDLNLSLKQKSQNKKTTRDYKQLGQLTNKA